MKKVQGHDSLHRINYLYQISKLIASKNTALSSYYGTLMINVAKKNVSKIHPEVKRQMCKKCRCMLIPNVSSKIKIKKKKHSKSLQWTCRRCKSKKVLPADKNKDHTLWIEKKEAIVEVIVS